MGQQMCSRLARAVTLTAARRRHAVRKYLCLGMLVSFLGMSGRTSLAQVGAGEIVGSVKDSSGAAVPNVVVEINGPVKRKVRTDQVGRFTVPDLPEGTYLVTASREGFANAHTATTLTGSGGRAEVALSLSPASWTDYVETVSKIQEAPLRVPVFVSGVTREELQRVAPPTLEAALRSVPGLQHATQANVFTRFETRGLRDTQDVLVLIDGVPLRQLVGNADLTMLPASAVQAVEFAKGPSSSIYGRSAVGGVAQFFTVPEDANETTGDLTATAGSWATYEGQGRLQVPFSKGRVSAAGFLSRSDTYQRNTGRDTEFVTAAGQYIPSQRITMRLQYLYSHVDAGRGSTIPLQNGQPLFGITPEDNFGLPAYFDATWNAVTLRAALSLGTHAFLTNNLSVSRYDRFYNGGVLIVPPPEARSKGYFESDSREETLVNDLLFRWEADIGEVRSTFLAGASLELGGQDLHQPTFTNAPTYRGPDYLNPVSGPNAANDPRGIRGATIATDYGQNIESLYFQERLERGRLGGVIGLRWDRFDQEFLRSNADVESAQIKSRVSPRVGVDFQVLRKQALDLALFGNWVEGFRPQFPSLSTVNALVVPQLLRPEVTRSFEGGFKVRSGKIFGQASFFNMRKIDGQRSFRTGPDDFLFVNALFRVKGIESELRARLSKAHSLYVHYSFHDAKHLSFNPSPTLDFSGNRLRMSARHIAGAGYTLSLGHWTWTSSLGYVGSRPLRDNVVNQFANLLPSYTTVNSSVSAEYGRIRVILTGTNLTDEFYIADDMSATDSGYPGPPRRLGLQVQYRF
jgi:outer membrane receptor protein involved in Fe transport